MSLKALDKKLYQLITVSSIGVSKGFLGAAIDQSKINTTKRQLLLNYSTQLPLYS